MSAVLFSLAGGVFAAAASVLGKLAFDGEQPHLATLAGLAGMRGSEPVMMALRVLCFVGLLVANGVMIGFFVKAMARSSSAQATITNSGFNFGLTALAGWALFNEPLPPEWWLGASFIISGLLVVARGEARAAALAKLAKQKED